MSLGSFCWRPPESADPTRSISPAAIHFEVLRFDPLDAAQPLRRWDRSDGELLNAIGAMMRWGLRRPQTRCP